MGRKRNRKRKSKHKDKVSGEPTVYYTPPEKDIKERHESHGIVELDDEDTPVFELDYTEGINPVIHVPVELGDKIWYITRKLKTEWLCVLTGEKRGIEYFIDGMVVPKQTNTGAHSLSEEAVGTPRLIGWLHSHEDMSVFFSSEDEQCNQRLPCSIVVNKKGEWKGQATVCLENGNCIKLNARVDWGVEPEDEKEPEWYAEVKEKFLAKSDTPVYKALGHCGTSRILGPSVPSRYTDNTHGYIQQDAFDEDDDEDDWESRYKAANESGKLPKNFYSLGREEDEYQGIDLSY